MGVIKGRNCRVELSATFGAPIAVQTVPQGFQPVCVANAHGLVNYSCGYFYGCVGMTQLEGQGVQVAAVTAAGFTLPGLNTSKFDAYASGQIVPVLTWLTLAEATSYTLTVPDAVPLNRTNIRDVQARRRAGLLGGQSLACTLHALDEPSAAMLVAENAAMQGFELMVRITHMQNGWCRILHGQPSLSGEDVQIGAVGTGALMFMVDGFCLRVSGITAPPPAPPAPSPPPAPGSTYVDPTYVAPTYVE